MKNTIKLALVAALTGPVLAHAAEDKLAKLEDRVAELEAAQSVNIFKFGGFLSSRYDNMKAKQTFPTGVNAVDVNLDYLRVRGALDFSGDLSKHIKIYGRLGFSKFANPFYTQTVSTTPTTTAPVLYTDLLAATSEAGPQTYFEKFYSDITLGDTGMVFSFGRIPTADGPPWHYPNGRPRTGTYSGMLYNGELDGVALSYNKSFGDHSISLRVVDTPWTRKANTNGTLYASSDNVIAPTVANNANNARSLMDFFTVMAEYSVARPVFADNVSLIAQYYSSTSQVDGRSFSVGAGGSGSLDIINQNYAIYLGMDNLMNMGLDLSYTYLGSRMENHGAMTITGFATYYGVAARSREDVVFGSANLLTARYKVNSKNYLGVEYVDVASNTYVFDQNGEHLTQFYGLPGIGVHSYWLYKATPELGIRLGYIDQVQRDSFTTFGPTSVCNRTLQTFYANVRVDF